MIKIINVKPAMPDKPSTYEVWINDEQIITTFEHKRIDGIGICLKLAGEAAEKAQWQKAYKILSAYMQKP